MFEAMNVVCEQPERRSFVALDLQSLGFTLAAPVFALVSLGAIVVPPIALNFVGLPGASAQTLSWLRWPLLYCGLVLALAVLYRFSPSPSRDPPPRLFS